MTCNVNLMFGPNSWHQFFRRGLRLVPDWRQNSLEISTEKRCSLGLDLIPLQELGPQCCEYTVCASIYRVTGTLLAHGMCPIIFDTLLTPSSRFLLSSQQEDEATVIKEDNDQCQPLGLAWYLLWCHILVYSGLWPMPKSTHSRQLSDRLPFIRMTSLSYLITFHRLFQAWEFFSPGIWNHHPTPLHP